MFESRARPAQLDDFSDQYSKHWVGGWMGRGRGGVVGVGVRGTL